MSSEKSIQAKELAMARFDDMGPGHINCTQAVLTYALQLMDLDCELIKIAAYFGGGVAGKGKLCGTLAGMAISFGLRDYHFGAPDMQKMGQTKETIKRTMDEFAEEFGSCSCLDLTGYDLSTPEGMEAFHESEDRDNCRSYISFVIDSITSLLENR